MADWIQDNADPSKFGELKPRSLDADGRPVWYWPTLDERLKKWGRLHPDKKKLYEAIGYRPSQKQAQIHSSQARIRIFSGGARGGKSLVGAMELLPILLTPATQSWLVAPRYDLAKEFQYLLQALRLPQMEYFHSRIRTMTDNPKNGDCRIVIKWSDEGDKHQIPDSWVQVKSSMVEDSLLGEELDAVLVSEASRIHGRIWSEYLLQRLTTRKGIAFFPSTPRGLGNWFGKLVLLGQDPQQIEEKKVESLMVTSVDNPVYDQSEADFAKAHLTEEEYNEQVEGRPTALAGSIYPDWLPEVHVKDFKEEGIEPHGATMFIGVDFGFTNPASIVWGWQDFDDRWYIGKEFYKRKQSIDDLAVAIAEGCGWGIERGQYGRVGSIDEDDSVEAIFCDWEPRSIRELNALGISAQRVPSKDVTEGIRCVRKALSLREDGTAGLVVDKSCVNLIREMNTYRYQEDRTRVGNQPQSEKPVKRDDHSCDALRYLLHGATRVGGMGVI